MRLLSMMKKIDFIKIWFIGAVWLPVLYIFGILPWWLAFLPFVAMIVYMGVLLYALFAHVISEGRRKEEEAQRGLNHELHLP